MLLYIYQFIQLLSVCFIKSDLRRDQNLEINSTNNTPCV